MSKLYMTRHFYFALFFLFFACFQSTAQSVSDQYISLQRRLAQGWNTWSYGSMLTHILLPSGLGVNINFRQSFMGTIGDPSFLLTDAVVDKTGLIQPIAHTVNGAYTELMINNWHGNTIRVQSASMNDELYLLITPLIKSKDIHYNIELQAGMLWNNSGRLHIQGNNIIASVTGKNYRIQSTATSIKKYQPYLSPYLTFSGDSTISIYTGAKKSLQQVQDIIANANKEFHKEASAYGELQTAYEAIQTVLGWNTIYDAEQQRIITPVSRSWNKAWQGYVLFEWDTFFASYLFGLYDKDYAYSNAIADVKGINKLGHLGHWQMPGKLTAVGMSQPPVGSMICWKLYEKYHDQWFLKEVYNELLRWNRWWMSNRMNKGFLAWGGWKGAEIQIAKWESGLDNSPMYSQAKMNVVGEQSVMNLADVGLNSLYAADCFYLSKMAHTLGKMSDEKELLQRQKYFSDATRSLWSDDAGIYLNRFTDTSTFSKSLSPTLFYPLLADVATESQAAMIIKMHYYNKSEFYGDYIMPSIARSDTAYDNEYWRGSAWPPMNFLVYLGLKKYDRQAAKDLANKSYEMFMTSWMDHNVFENINSLSGPSNKITEGNRDPFYHWGALMGIMQFMEAGKY